MKGVMRVRVDQNRLTKAVDFLEKSIDEDLIPGATVIVTYQGETILFKGLGKAHKEKQNAITKETIYDVASLTKVCATLPSILTLIENGELIFDDPVSRFIPEFQDGSTKINLRHLLTHTSGLPASSNFHEKKYTLEEAIHKVCHLSPNVEPGTKVIYSDLNFILLGWIVEKISDQRLDQFAKQHIYDPLGMIDTEFNPPVEKRNRIAATEFSEEINDYIWGVVHDENARSLGGICGHAGLFSTAKDLEIYGQCFLNGGSYNGKVLFSEQTVEIIKANYTKHLGISRGIGWQLVDDSYTPAGDLFPRNAYGHTGFTGTSIWLDQDLKLSGILLTNRVHYGRLNHILRIRKIFYNLISSALIS
jgi:CubicO group peptidase (beta-lactamase class C family)